MDRLREVETVFDLVRHAHANWSPDEMRPLSNAGAREARRVSWLLRQRREATVPPISLVISSPSLRARQTVAPLAAHLDLPLTIEIDLRERALGQDLGDVAAFRAAVRATWEDASFSLPGGETNSAAQARGVAVLEACHLNHGGEHIVLGTHGNLLALILQHFDATVDFEFWSALTMPDIYRVRTSATGEAQIEHLWLPELASS